MTCQWIADNYKGSLPWLKDRTIFLTRAGSHAYGTSLPSSDLDVRGIALAPRNHYLGFLRRFEQAEQKGDPDLVVFDLQKFLKLASETNPNVIEILFTDSSDWIHSSPQWEHLHSQRHLFVSKKAKVTFSGYAISQLRRIRSHRQWLLNPPKGKPSREDFGLSVDHRKLNRDQMGAFDKLLEEGHSFPDHIMMLLAQEKAYISSLNEWNQYENWKAKRNPARAEMEARFGYDGKHAMHLVRLMRMCLEILETGQVNVKRPDAAQLLEIRNGAWTYDELIEWAERQEQTISEAASILPDRPEYERIDDLCCQIIEEFA
jgi:predicted nucleotidyltransferase